MLDQEKNKQEALQQEPRQEEAPAENREEASENLFQEHFAALEKQSQELKEKFPSFDLAKALQNPVFLQLTAPGTGITVADAYYALHREEIEKAQASETARKIVSAIQSGSRRPLEAGTAGQGPTMTTFHYGSASKEQREAFKKELRRKWARGEPAYSNR